MSNSKISQALQALFEKHRIVFWYDAKDEFKTDFEQLQLHGVEKIQLNNNEFGVKHRLLRLEPDHKFLLYAAYPQPDDLENWLLDIQLAQGEFRTDQVALWLAELELGLGFADVIKAHSEFFQASKRKDSLKRLLVADDTPHLVRLKMLSICSSADSGLDTILESLLAELADDRDDKIRLIQRCSLDGFLWQQLQRHYSYESTNPSIKDFSLELFKSCYALATAQTAKLSHHALVFLKRWKDSVKHRQYFEKLSESCAKDLGIEQLLETHDFRQLMDMDYVELIDRKILRELVQGVTQRTLLHNEVSQWVRQRRSSYWYDRFAHVYNAIDAASAFIYSLNSTKLDISSLADGIQRYSQEWFKLDQYYRKFIYHLRESKQPSLLHALNTLIENLYSNNYLLTLNDRWQVFVDNASTWDSTSFPSQRQFFNRSVKPFLERNAKVCVIISDALRYEVGEELLSLVRQEDRYDANLEPMVSMLPSYTQLGMAALLPHQQLAIADNQTGETLVDGQSSKGSDNRKKILNKRLSASDVVLAKNFMVLNRDDSRAIVRDNDVLYIYHNLIDKTGDSLGTEERTFDAAEQTLVEMISLIKKLTNANVNNILLTADHGFIYQDQTLAESDFLSSDPQASTVLYRNRRFLLGKGFQPHPSFKHFHSSQLGLVGDVEVMLPKSINRLRLQGSGSRFVHGAASLQEVVIPLLHINKKRQSDLSQVDIEVLRGSANKITTNHLSVILYQLQPVTDKCRPRTLRIGLYSEAGALISDSHDVIFDRHSDNAREREIPIRLMLTSQADNLNGQTVSLRLDEQIDGTSHYKPYTALNYLMQRSFARDFDFLEQPVMSQLDDKINEHFSGLVVRKDLVKTVKGNAIVPSYVLEYLLGQYCASNDELTIQNGIGTVKEILRKHYVHRNESGLVRSIIKEKGRHKVIDRISVSLNEKKDAYEAEFANLGIKKVLIDSDTVKAHSKLLVSGVWCIADVEYDFSEDKDASPWILGSLKPIQLSHLDFDAYTHARRFFSTDEWIDLLIQSMGFEPTQFSKRNKFNQLVRLIPFCERNYNLIELGPKGTGKSHIYSEFSPHGILISGGEVTTPKLFVHNGTGKVGLVGYWDTIAFDEFAGKKKRVDKALVDIMKNYMANKTFSRGIETLGAEASMVFVGNTQHSVPHMLKHSDLFNELPESYHDSAFLDRIHFYIAGWEVDIIRGEMFSQGYGFVVDYLAEVLRALRSHDYSDRYKAYFTLSSDISTRDRDAINKTFSGLMKILYPDGQASESDIQELLDLAMEGRKRVKDQLLRIDNTYSKVSFSYRNQRDEIHHITTKEEEAYPNYYHKKTNTSDMAISESYQDDALFAIPSTSIANDSATKTNDQDNDKSELTEQQITWPEGATGFSLHDCITPYLQQATEVTISDPNIGLIHQQDNLLELLTTIANAKPPSQQSNVQLIITTDLFMEEQQDSDLQHIAKACLDVGITLTWQFVPSTDITESFIQTNTGWKIQITQGLNIYQPIQSHDKFSLTTRLPQYRPCRAFEMRISGSD